MTPQEKNQREREQVEALIAPETQKAVSRGFSPSGRFELDLSSYPSGPNQFACTRLVVRRVSDGQVVSDLVRNYHSLPSLVTKGEQEYLIWGRSYMSQTIVNLDTGAEMEPEGYHYEDHAFCWAGAGLMSDNQTLLVDGCHWAAPYEFRFYDFSDPEGQGWPEIPVVELETWEEKGDAAEKMTLWADAVEPVLNPDGTITVVETTPHGDGEPRVDVKLTLERRGAVLAITDIWQSQFSLEQVAKNQARQEKQDADFAHWKASDVTLVLLQRTLEDHPKLKPLAERIGMIGSSGKARDEGEKNLWFFYPEISSKTPMEQWRHKEWDDDAYDPRWARLKWGTVAGDTITAELVSCSAEHGDCPISKTFPKTEEGLMQALEEIQGFLDGEKK